METPVAGRAGEADQTAEMFYEVGVKLRRAHIQNFKGVRECVLDLQPDPGAPPRRLTALVGDNGSGKTTVLQAIALTISLATQRTRTPASLRWHGFLAERLGTLGPTRVELGIQLDPGEIEQTSALYERCGAAAPRSGDPAIPPAHPRARR